jgi:hypothetical protein
MSSIVVWTLFGALVVWGLISSIVIYGLLVASRRSKSLWDRERP